MGENKAVWISAPNTRFWNVREEKPWFEFQRPNAKIYGLDKLWRKRCNSIFEPFARPQRSSNFQTLGWTLDAILLIVLFWLENVNVLLCNTFPFIIRLILRLTTEFDRSVNLSKWHFYSLFSNSWREKGKNDTPKRQRRRKECMNFQLVLFGAFCTNIWEVNHEPPKTEGEGPDTFKIPSVVHFLRKTAFISYSLKSQKMFSGLSKNRP